MKRVCGYDLNGWRDSAARNWNVVSGEEVEVSPIFEVSGGCLSSAVKVELDDGVSWVGGAQTTLAVQGKGPGWGKLGNSENRLSLFSCLSIEDQAPLEAYIGGLNRGASHAVVSLNDEYQKNEAAQDKLISALSRNRITSSLLVWRSVLAALYLIEKSEVKDMQTIGVISHAADGFSLQKLKIRSYKLPNGKTVLAPERKENSQFITSNVGYAGLHQLAKKYLYSKSQLVESKLLNWSTSVSQLAMGEDVNIEVIKDELGEWQVLNDVKSLTISDVETSEWPEGWGRDCDFVVFESLTSGEVRKSVRNVFVDVVNTSSYIGIPNYSIRQSAFWAANRFSESMPVYFDFLPQISTIVQNRDGDAENFDLIDESETLPAGSIYRSKEPAKFSIRPGQTQIAIYLNKENEQWPRKALIDIDYDVLEATPIELWTEQSPASGAAKIYLYAENLRAQYTVDWLVAEEINKNWEELIRDLDQPLPSIPNRLVLKCGIELWDGFRNVQGLSSVLKSNQGNWDLLAKSISKGREGRYCISSDGDLPNNLNEASIKLLEDTNQLAIDEIRERINGDVIASNHSLRFLTWQFKGCPEEIVDYLLQAFFAIQNNEKHVFVAHPASKVLIYQGLGRIVTEEETEKILIETILKKPIIEWKYREDTACIAFILSRSMSAPLLLSRDDVELIAKRVFIEFRNQLGGAYTKFNYAPLLLVGLLRWRLVEPRALVVGRDPIADEMNEVVEDTINDLESTEIGNTARRFLPILILIKEEIQGEGRTGDLLGRIYNA